MRVTAMGVLLVLGCAAPKTALEECRPPDCFATTGAKAKGWDNDQLRRRAAFDFGCPAMELELTKLDHRTGGVRGCGKQATYMESCAVFPCTWVLNADVHAIAPTP